MERETAWKKYSENDLKELNMLSANYKRFLDGGKTERECVKEIIKIAENAGYRDLSSFIKNNENINKGSKVYSVLMGKSIILFNIGERDIEEGMNILGAHIDSPRIDIKQNPLYEDSGLGYLDTHYYGGIKKYQWVTTPLAIHGVVAKKNGEVINIVIGEEENDPVFCITDILVHLSAEQMEKKAAKVIEGEALDILIGSRPVDDEDKDGVKANILKLLNKKYSITEEDFISAELEVVPAGMARDCGLDESMVIGYGQDDRVCAYTSIAAMIETEEVEKTACCILVDKEEIGSVGATGMHSRFFENTVAEIIDRMEGFSDIKLRRCLQSSKMLSSDVSAAYDPAFPSCFEKKNSAFFGKGMVFNKFTGARGKSGSNDANAEYIAEIRKVMDDNNVSFQTAELGKVDAGGGGTIAYILANYGMNVIDCGVAVLNMHAPYEITSKADIFETKKGYQAFIKNI